MITPYGGTPIIDEPPKPEGDPYKATKGEVDSFLKERGLEFGRRNRRRARRRIRRRKIKQARIRGAEISFSQPEAPWQVVYGVARVPAVIPFMHENNGNNWLHHVCIVAAHEINSIQKLYLNGDEIEFNTGSNPDPRWASGPAKDPTSYDNKVFMATFNGLADQTVQGDLNAQLPSLWTSNHRLRNHAGCYLILKRDGILFSEGHPDIEFLVYGKPVYDPRISSTAFSNNAALCIADYITDTKFGLGYSLSDLDTDSLTDAADVCDESVSLLAGGSEARYLLNGYFTLDQDPGEILDDMTTAFGGTVDYSGGKWRFLPAKYRTPTITLTLDDIRSAATLTTLSGRNDKFNGVRASFVDSTNNEYKIKEAPSYISSTYKTEDGGEEIIEEVTLPFTTSASTAQRLARIELERARRDVILAASWSLKAFQLAVGDTVQVTIDRYGFSSKVFEVMDFGFSFSDDLQPFVDLLLQETDSTAYSWTPGTDETAMVQPSSTDLPLPYVAGAPSGLTVESGTDHLFIRSDGTVVTRMYVAWTSPSDAFVTDGGRIQVQYAPSGSGAWQDGPNAFDDQTFVYIFDAQDGVQYDIRIRSVNAIGVTSDWIYTTHTVVGKTEPPTTITNLNATIVSDGVNLSWPGIPDKDLLYYEVRVGASGSAIETTEVAGLVNGTTYKYTQAITGTRKFFVRAVDTSANYGTAATREVSPAAPGAVTNLQHKNVDNFLTLDWEPPSTGSYAIAYYNIYKGATAAASNLFSRVDGTYFQYFTTSGENAVFWVEPVDVGGNKGPATSISAAIYPPADYELKSSGSPTIASSTLSNAADVSKNSNGSAFIAPVNTTETFAEHFTNNSYTSLPLLFGSRVKNNIQAFIDDPNLTVWAQPAYSSDGYVEWDVDLGVTVPGSRISLLYDVRQLGIVAATVTPSFLYKDDIADPWSSESGSKEIYATNFRHIRFRITVSGGDERSIAEIANIEWRIQVKQKDETQTLTSDAGTYKRVTFTNTFLDVSDIQITPAGDSEGFSPVYDFTDAPNPTYCDVYIFDKDGTQVAVEFKIRIRGTIAPGVT